MDSSKPIPEKSSPPEPQAPPKNRRFLLIYTIALFTIAFALVLLSYLAQVRRQEQEIDALKDQQNNFSVSALQNIDSLTLENTDLKDVNERQLEQIAALETQLDESEQSLTALQSELALLGATLLERQVALEAAEQSAQALGYLWRLEVLYRDKQYSDCRDVLTQMGQGSLHELLSTEEPSGGGDSPRARYDQIADALS